MTMGKQNILSEKRTDLSRPLILNGAMGSLLQMNGFNLDQHLWASKLNIDQPEVIKSIHQQYIDAGSNIITTNTFRTNPIAKKNSTLTITNSEFVKRSVFLAIETAKNKNVIVAGSNAPAEDCYQKKRTITRLDLEYNHKKHIEMLWEAGVDLIWNETQSHLDEIEFICGFCDENKIPFTMNLFCDKNLNLLSDEPVTQVIELISSYSPLATGINCIHRETLKKLLQASPSMSLDGFYLNCGKDNICADEIICSISPMEYSYSLQELLRPNLLFVGSCCGSTPFHTKYLRDTVDAIYRN